MLVETEVNDEVDWSTALSIISAQADENCSPMVTLPDGTHAYINDVVCFNHAILCLTLGTVHKIFQQVKLLLWCHCIYVTFTIMLISGIKPRSFH